MISSELIAKVWKEPAFFLAHPRAHRGLRDGSARGEAFRRPRSRSLARPSSRGADFLYGFPTDKLKIGEGPNGGKATTNILLLRTGEKKRGVVGLFLPGIPGEISPSLSVRLMGINARGAASYLVSLYCSAAILTDDAIGVLEHDARRRQLP